MKYRGLITWLNIHKKDLINAEEYSMADVMDDAIEVINLHTPERPEWDFYGSRYVLFCPNCKDEIEQNDSICKHCTKLIDWSDGNDEK